MINLKQSLPHIPDYWFTFNVRFGGSFNLHQTQNLNSHRLFSPSLLLVIEIIIQPPELYSKKKDLERNFATSFRNDIFCFKNIGAGHHYPEFFRIQIKALREMIHPPPPPPPPPPVFLVNLSYCYCYLIVYFCDGISNSYQCIK